MYLRIFICTSKILNPSSTNSVSSQTKQFFFSRRSMASPGAPSPWGKFESSN